MACGANILVDTSGKSSALLLDSGVAACGRQVMGTVHGIEILHVVCPEISRNTAADITDFARSAS